MPHLGSNLGSNVLTFFLLLFEVVSHRLKTNDFPSTAAIGFLPPFSELSLYAECRPCLHIFQLSVGPARNNGSKPLHGSTLPIRYRLPHFLEVKQSRSFNKILLGGNFHCS